MRKFLTIAFVVLSNFLFAQTENFENVNVTNKLGVGTDTPEESIHIKYTSDYGLLLQRAEYTDGQKNVIRFASSGSVGVVSAYLGSVRATQGTGHLVFGTNYGNPILNEPVERLRITSDGKFGFGTTTPSDKMTLTDTKPIFCLRGRVANQIESGRIRFCEYPGTRTLGAYIHYDGSANILHLGVHTIDGDNDTTNDNNALSIIRSTGNVGIGTQAPGSYKLAVNGTIRAKEIKVEADWADFVFKDDYQLMKLSELEQFIQENGHLPDIPTEKEVEAEGISLGEMNSKLLQKIEEQTLYILQLQKQLSDVNIRLEKIEKSN